MKEQQLIQYIPYDKSWMIRMGILDLRFGKDTCLRALAGSQIRLSDDLKALMNALLSFPKEGREVIVGESATLFRFLQFLAWTTGQEKVFIREGTLKDRQITTDSSIVKLPIEKLLALDSGTSQWASAAILCRDEEEVIVNPPYKLALTYEAVKHWKECYDQGQVWIPRLDATIQRQAEAFLTMRYGEKTDFLPLHSEDYCFARALGFSTAGQGANRWSSLRGHESNRLLEMEKALQEANERRPVSSSDHRVVEATAMFARIYGIPVRFARPECVAKSWPMFWEFMKETEV